MGAHKQHLTILGVVFIAATGIGFICGYFYHKTFVRDKISNKATENVGSEPDIISLEKSSPNEQNIKDTSDHGIGDREGSASVENATPFLASGTIHDPIVGPLSQPTDDTNQQNGNDLDGLRPGSTDPSKLNDDTSTGDIPKGQPGIESGESGASSADPQEPDKNPYTGDIPEGQTDEIGSATVDPLAKLPSAGESNVGNTNDGTSTIEDKQKGSGDELQQFKQEFVRKLKESKLSTKIINKIEETLEQLKSIHPETIALYFIALGEDFGLKPEYKNDMQVLKESIK